MNFVNVIFCYFFHRQDYLIDYFLGDEILFDKKGAYVPLFSNSKCLKCEREWNIGKLFSKVNRQAYKELGIKENKNGISNQM